MIESWGGLIPSTIRCAETRAHYAHEWYNPLRVQCPGGPDEAVQLCPDAPHREPQGPNEDVAQCPRCWMPTYAMRPEKEQIGLHDDDCSLPRRHEGYCVGGGEGHPPTEVVRGYWPGMDADVAAARERHK